MESNNLMTEQSKQNTRKFGKDILLWQMQEECAELIQAVAKYNRCRGIGQITEVSKQKAEQNLVKELADVEICLEQVKFLLNLDKDVKQAKQEALDKATKPTS